MADARQLVGGLPRWAWLGAYVLATFFSFPVGGSDFDLGALVSWLGPAFLVVGLRGLAPGRAALLAFSAGLLAHSAVLHWIYVVTVTYGHAPVMVGVAAPMGLAAYVAAHTALFGAIAARLAARGFGSPLLLAAAWTALEHLRSFSLTGFPWATLGYAQHENPALLGLATLTGVYGLSFVTVAGGLAFVDLAGDPRRRRGWTALGVILALHGLGIAAGGDSKGWSEAPRIRVAVLQGNIDQGAKWSPEWADRTLAIYSDLTLAAAEEGAQVILWPETAVPGSVNTDPDLRARLGSLARHSGATLIVGGVGIERLPDGSRYFDSAFLFDRDGVLRGRYDKAHLVPFGEYVPLRDLFGRFFSAVARGIASTDVSAGDAPARLAVPVGDDFVPAGVPICYELLFPNLVRRFVVEGAGVLFAITNDAWYGRTGAPHQFLAITALRSAENRIWTARAANTGVSAFIDHRGRVVQKTGIFERGFLLQDVPIGAPPVGGTFYTQRGDVFAWGCWIGVAAAVLRRGRRDAEGKSQE